MIHVHTCALHTVDLLSLSISMTLNSFESIQSNHFYPIMLHQPNARPHRSMSIHMCMFPQIYILPSNSIHPWSRSGRCCPGNWKHACLCGQNVATHHRYSPTAHWWSDEVLLRFQPPHLDINTLEMDGHVYCASPSQDGTMLAVGCQRSFGGMGKSELWFFNVF